MVPSIYLIEETNRMYSIENIEKILANMSHAAWGWPLVIFVILASIIFTYAFNGIQFTHFFKAWKLIAIPEKTDLNSTSISPFQAFVNALSASLGNGGLAGMATVLVGGGPGTVFWIFILGFFTMGIRFTEVYAATKLSLIASDSKYSGPLLYIKSMPFGKFFVYLYSIVMFIYILFAGNAMQCNSMGLSLFKITGWPIIYIALLFSLIVIYIIFGGAQRIMKFSQIIIPVKVLLFFAVIFYVLIYYAERLPDAFRLIMANAFNTDSFGKGLISFSVHQAICIGFSRALNATEGGVGTAGIFFGASKTKNPLKTSIISIITTFISTNLVCTLLILSLIVSGVWDSGLTSTALVIDSFKPIFGLFSGPLITFLSFSFGLGVLVAYAFLGQKMWEFLFGNNGIWIYTILFGSVAFFGTLSSVSIIWNSLDFLVAILIFINILGLLFVLPKLKKLFDEDLKREIL